MRTHEIELAYNILRDNFSCLIISNAEYANMIKRDFHIFCTERDIDMIQSAYLSEEMEDLEMQYNHYINN